MKKLLLLLVALIIAVSPAVFILPEPASAAPPDAYWVGDGGNWADDLNHWALASGGAPGAGNLPDATTNVHFDANSFTVAGQSVTRNADAFANNMDWTGATNYPTLTSAGGNLKIYGNITFIAAMTVSTNIDWYNTSGNVTITSNGVTINGTLSLKAAGTYGLADNYAADTSGSSSFYPNIAGVVFNTNNHNMSGIWAFSMANSTINLGSSSIGIRYQWEVLSGTVNAGTSTISVLGWASDGTADTFKGNGATYNDVVLEAGSDSMAITGANTFADLTVYGDPSPYSIATIAANQTVTGTFTTTGNAGNYRLQFRSNTLHTARTVTAAVITSTYTDFRDITGAGAGSWDLSAGTAGDTSGNTNITFPVSRTVYAVSGTGNYDWSNGAKWSNASGGVASSVYFPRPQDTAVFDANSIAVPGVIIGMDSPSISAVDARLVTNSPTFQHFSVTQTMVYMYGSLRLGSGGWDVDQTYMYGENANILSSTGTIIGGDLYIDSQTGSVSLESDITLLDTTDVLFLTSGILNLAGYDVTAGRFDSSTTTYQRTLVMGTGTITLNTTAAVTKWSVAAANLTITPNTSKIVFTNSTANGQTFAGAGLIYYDLTIQGSGNYTTTMTGNNTFHDLIVDRSQAAKTLAGAVTLTITHLYIPQVGATVVTITNTDFTKTSGLVALKYMTISGSSAAGGATFLAGKLIAAGGGSTDGGGNAGWVFDDAVAPTVVTNAATSLSNTGANLKGNLGNMGSFTGETVYAYFEYGLTVGYGTTTAEQPKTVVGDFNQLIGSLTPDTLYHYRAVIRYDSVDYAYGTDVTFTTLGAPTVTTLAATGITAVSATLQGQVTLGVYTPVYVRFDYGITTGYGLTTSWQTFTTPSNFSAVVNSLQTSQTYHFRAVGLYAAASYVYGSDLTFVALDTAGSDADPNARDVLPPITVSNWYQDPDVSGTLLANPFRPLVVMVSDNTTMSEIQVWRWYAFMIIVVVTVACARAVPNHLFIAGAGAGLATGAAVALTIYPMWALIFVAGEIAGGMVAERKSQL